MVRIRKKSKQSLSKEYLAFGFVVVAALVVLWLYPKSAASVSLGDLNVTKSDIRGLTSEKEAPKNQDEEKSTPQRSSVQCPITRIANLKPEEQHPVAGSRHMVTPPEGGSQHLVCCTTSKGPFTALVHEKWAPNGAQRFLDMVKNGYFDSTVPLMRCVKGFLCQFGLNSDPNKTKLYRQRLDDDPNWLPEGPTNRQNEQGVYRFAQGYLAYAGSGKNSRTNQLIISLQHQQSLAGGSPWEVPWGEIVGEHSFETWSKVYTGYGENGPGQGKLINNGMTDEMRKEFPELDYITGCSIVDQIIVE